MVFTDGFPPGPASVEEAKWPGVHGTVVREYLVLVLQPRLVLLVRNENRAPRYRHAKDCSSQFGRESLELREHGALHYGSGLVRV